MKITRQLARTLVVAQRALAVAHALGQRLASPVSRRVSAARFLASHSASMPPGE
ncbi:hypothetical protein [Mesorhizobium sp. ORS 3428]|uniref:hypothetical protein n=1 Tax=Mesorhizobium sp. ORS 3428 TaxID=540997 RepID=UPI0012FF645C|nr:hypothetical protein [Mesorhizobium sp. ORS 3428]